MEEEPFPEAVAPAAVRGERTLCYMKTEEGLACNS